MMITALIGIQTTCIALATSYFIKRSQTKEIETEIGF
jgi:hypothetical protein